MATIQDALNATKLPWVYSHFKTRQDPPYLVYLGSGQNATPADNTYYYATNSYQIEYYFTEKDEAQEAVIEESLLDNGFLYEKSEDVFIDDEGVFVIYYTT